MRATRGRSWSPSSEAPFLAADLGLYLEPRVDHAAYLVQGDERAIVSAAAHGERAVKFMDGFSRSRPPRRRAGESAQEGRAKARNTPATARPVRVGRSRAPGLGEWLQSQAPGNRQVRSPPFPWPWCG